MQRWFALVLLAPLAGCGAAGSEAPAPARTQPGSLSTVFTVPAKLPPRAATTTAAHRAASTPAPAKVAAIITAANQVAHAPYRYGGGHGGVNQEGTWVDSAYDCSGSVSFALASAGLLERQLDSTSFESWGKPGAGKWVTVFANADHAFMVVAGLRFDTVERARTGTRWGLPPTSVSGFVLRHPQGL
jgi:hypothetical protein